jgi:molybdopterin-guanine dinucleotide biosynthesis protein A
VKLLTSTPSSSPKGKAERPQREIEFSAVLLAGGESRRMGKDKATVMFRGKPLWRIQLDLLRKLAPAQIFISARSDPPWRPNEFEFVADDPPSCGPLSGLAAALLKMRGSHLLALAIDMPFMNQTYLRLLCARAEEGRGVLPMIQNCAEPLGAIYPAEVRKDFVAALSGNDFSLQQLTKRLVASGKLCAINVTNSQEKFYWNLNERIDLNLRE